MIAKEVEESAIVQSFLTMLDSEHGDLVVQDLSLSSHLEQHTCSEVAQQVDASFVDTQEIHGVDMSSHPEMLIARDIRVDACSVQLASTASVASAFGGLIYEMLISRAHLAAVVGAFAVGVVNYSMIDVGIDHGGDMQVLRSYLQDVCGMSSGVWTYTRARQSDTHDHQPSMGIG